MKLKIKRILFGLLALACSGYAAAQDSFYPTLRGTFSEHREDIGYFGALRLASNVGLTATASGTLANSQILSLGFSQFTTVASGNDSATLPSLNGSVMLVVNNSAASNAVKIWPNIAAGTINGGSAGAGVTVAAGKTSIFIQVSAGVWVTMAGA